MTFRSTIRYVKGCSDVVWLFSEVKRIWFRYTTVYCYFTEGKLASVALLKVPGVFFSLDNIRTSWYRLFQSVKKFCSHDRRLWSAPNLSLHLKLRICTPPQMSSRLLSFGWARNRLWQLRHLCSDSRCRIGASLLFSVERRLSFPLSYGGLDDYCSCHAANSMSITRLLVCTVRNDTQYKGLK